MVVTDFTEGFDCSYSAYRLVHGQHIFFDFTRYIAHRISKLCGDDAYVLNQCLDVLRAANMPEWYVFAFLRTGQIATPALFEEATDATSRQVWWESVDLFFQHYEAAFGAKPPQEQLEAEFADLAGRVAPPPGFDGDLDDSDLWDL